MLFDRSRRRHWTMLSVMLVLLIRLFELLSRVFFRRTIYCIRLVRVVYYPLITTVPVIVSKGYEDLYSRWASEQLPVMTSSWIFSLHAMLLREL